MKSKLVKFLTQEGLRPTGFSLEEKSPAPMLEELKQFICWYIASTKGRIVDTLTYSVTIPFFLNYIPLV